MRREKIIKMETAIDHLTGEEIGAALSSLNDMPEVLDAILLNGIGKKNRQAGLLQVLCHIEHENRVLMAIFRHTHTLGIRVERIERVILPRESGKMEVYGANLPAKFYEIDGVACSRPEADAIRELADEVGSGSPTIRLAREILADKSHSESHANTSAKK